MFKLFRPIFSLSIQPLDRVAFRSLFIHLMGIYLLILLPALAASAYADKIGRADFQVYLVLVLTLPLLVSSASFTRAIHRRLAHLYPNLSFGNRFAGAIWLLWPVTTVPFLTFLLTKDHDPSKNTPWWLRRPAIAFGLSLMLLPSIHIAMVLGEVIPEISALSRSTSWTSISMVHFLNVFGGETASAISGMKRVRKALPLNPAQKLAITSPQTFGGLMVATLFTLVSRSEQRNLASMEMRARDLNTIEEIVSLLEKVDHATIHLTRLTPVQLFTPCHALEALITVGVSESFGFHLIDEIVPSVENSLNRMESAGALESKHTSLLSRLHNSKAYIIFRSAPVWAKNAKWSSFELFFKKSKTLFDRMAENLGSAHNDKRNITYPAT